ncbi:TPA: hypothetical protein ACSPZQ_004009 [Aeromonas veronii]
MSKKLTNLELDKIKNESFISDIVFRSSDDCLVLYVSKDRVSEKSKTGFVSVQQLSNFQSNIIQKYDINCEVILIDSDNLDALGKGFEFLLKTTFPDFIQEVKINFLNSQNASIQIKISDSYDLNKEHVEVFLEKILTTASVETISIQWIEEKEILPNLIELLLKIKKLQPVTIKYLAISLSEDYQFLQEKRNWLNKQLDKLIKKHLIVREQVQATYCLTAQGLNVLPKFLNRYSSDIIRALDLGKRKW